MNWILLICTVIALLVSLIRSREKTLAAVKIAIRRMWNILPLFLLVMALFAISITIIPESFISKAIGSDSGLGGLVIAIVVGSVAMMPGFIAFPLCGALLSQGVPYYILAGFSLALMNVGFVTLPMQIQYLGFKVVIVRNLIGILAALLVAAVVAYAFGEVNLLW
jgi:uncharacterized membrane protein YraQ (UPF0718 family)